MQISITFFDVDERPYLVTDEACLYDIYIGDELELIHKVTEKYKVTIDKSHFKIPFWQLLDILEEKK